MEKESRKYDAPAILSLFIPGLGQFVKNEFFEATGFFTYWIIVIFINAFTISSDEFSFPQGLLIGLLLQLMITFLAVRDAYNWSGARSSSLRVILGVGSGIALIIFIFSLVGLLFNNS